MPLRHNNHRKSGTFMNQNHSIYRLLITCLWHFIIVIIIKARPTIADEVPTASQPKPMIFCVAASAIAIATTERLKINLFAMNYYSFCRKLLHRIILHFVMVIELICGSASYHYNHNKNIPILMHLCKCLVCSTIKPRALE